MGILYNPCSFSESKMLSKSKVLKNELDSVERGRSGEGILEEMPDSTKAQQQTALS